MHTHTTRTVVPFAVHRHPAGTKSHERNTRVVWVPTIADINAPTDAEITAGTDISDLITKDGLQTPADQNNIDVAGLSSNFDAQAVGSYGGTIQLTCFRFPTTAWDLMVYGTSGYLVVGRDSEGGIAVADVVEVYPAEMHQPVMMQTASNEAQKFTEQMPVTDDPATERCRRGLIWATLPGMDDPTTQTIPPAVAAELDIDDVLGQITQREASTQVCLDGKLLAEHAALELELTEATQRVKGDGESIVGNAEVDDIAKRLLALEAEIDAKKITFRFVAIGQQEWRDLIGNYPPRRVDKEVGLDHNPEKFPAAAIAASCASPKMTIEQANELDRRLNMGQFAKIWGACLGANLSGDDDPKSAAGSIRSMNSQLANTAAQEASPDPSSLAE